MNRRSFFSAFAALPLMPVAMADPVAIGPIKLKPGFSDEQLRKISDAISARAAITTVRIEGIDSNALFAGRQVRELLTRLQEAQRR